MNNDLLKSLTPGEAKVVDQIASVAQTEQIPTWLIGGFVRDKLLERPCTDLDVVCLGDQAGIRLAEALAQSLNRDADVVVYGRFGTAMLHVDGYDIEFVGARKESYQTDSRKPMVEDGTLEDDQNRRDFTINALAISLNQADYGSFVDPFDGLTDLESGLLTTPLDPSRTFSDDPLRMLRAIRFACQLEFRIAPETYLAIREQRDRLSIVSQERITTEINKIIATPKPSIGFKLLFDTGILELVFPEMAALHGVDVVHGHAHKDNFYHTLQVLDNLCQTSDRLWLRWAAILHDIAKPPTKRYEEKHGWTFHGHEVVGARMVPAIFKKLRLPLDEKMKYVRKMVRHHLRPIALAKDGVTDSAIRRLLFLLGDDIHDLMLLCEADITSKNETKVKRYLRNFELVRQKLEEVEERDRLRNWQPPIDGATIMAAFEIKPGKEIGIIKTAIREAILDGAIPNEYDAAYAFMLARGKELGLQPKSED